MDTTLQNKFQPVTEEEMKPVVTHIRHAFMAYDGITPTLLDIVGTATIAFLLKKKKTSFNTTKELQALIDQDVVDYTLKGFLLEFANKYWKMVDAAAYYPMDSLRAVVLTYREESRNPETSSSLCSLVRQILDIQQQDTVVDMGSSYSQFLVDASLNTRAQQYYGVEPDHSVALIGKMCEWILQKENVHIVQKSILKDDLSAIEGTKIFYPVPFDIRNREPFYFGTDTLDKLPHSGKAQWHYIWALLQQMKKWKTIVYAVPNSVLFSSARRDVAIRRYWVEQQLLQSVISLPPGMLLPYSAVSMSLLVVSHQNRAVRFIEASEMGTKSRKSVVLSEEEIANIVHQLHDDTENSLLVSNDAVIQQETCSWVPSKYITKQEDIVLNGVAFQSIIRKVKRGFHISSKTMADVESEEPTPYRYLKLQNVQPGEIVGTMSYLKELDKRGEKSLVYPGDIVMSRTAPFKAAVIPEMGTNKVIASGNMFGIEINTQKFNPIYIMLYLNSPQGMRQLEARANGAVIKTISQGDLGEIQIPMIPLEEQQRIADTYMKLQAKLAALKKEEETIRTQIQQLVGGHA